MTKRRFAGGTYDPVRLFATVTSAPQRTRAAPTPRQDRGLLSLQLWLGPHGILALNLAMHLIRTSRGSRSGPINAHQPQPRPHLQSLAESRMPGPPKLWRKKEPPEPAETGRLRAILYKHSCSAKTPCCFFEQHFGNKIDHEPTICGCVVSLQYFGACRSCAS